MSKIIKVAVFIALWVGAATVAAQQTAAQTRAVDIHIASQPMNEALNQLASQTGVRVVFFPQAVQGLTAPRLSGTFTPDEAFKRLLSQSNLTWRFMDSRTVEVRAAGEVGDLSPSDVRSTIQLAQISNEAAAAQSVSQELESNSKAVPEILVKGSKLLNSDIRRSPDDALPYVVFDKETIERTGARSVEEFLRFKLTSMTVGRSLSQQSVNGGLSSNITMRGLTSDQTLILIDGRRSASLNQSGRQFQTDLNRIPTAMTGSG